ncbi:MAG TPA: serpin family protein [Pirellulales bacterium]|jgi:serpin B|nr:serpin family protein [Pirellulales bacterium]
MRFEFRFLWIGVCGVIGLMVQSRPLTAAAPQPPAPNEAAVIESGNQFALDLYGQLAAADGNLFFSPQSISSALAMTYTGAGGDTAAQMAKVLHLGGSPDAVAAGEAALMQRLNDAGKRGLYQLSVANRLWGAQGFHFLNGFLKTLHENYQADLQQLDFSHAQQAAQTINDWVAQATRDKIKDLISASALGPMTKLVLTNAVYFKGKWESPFKPTLTQPAPFTLSSGKQVTVPLMFLDSRMRYGEFDVGSNAALQVLELPYTKGELSLVALLPKSTDGLAGLEKQLTSDNLKKWTSGLQERPINIWLPKFKLSTQLELGEVLSKLGMPLAFSAEADFSGMDGKHDLFISAVVHKAYVDVNEEGTEAAAATGVVMRALAMPPPPLHFRADHPFVFLIRENATGSILFLGRVTDPRSDAASK